MIFTAHETEHLSGQPLGRLTTVGARGRPHTVPVGASRGPETRAIVIRARRIPGRGIDTGPFELSVRDVT